MNLGTYDITIDFSKLFFHNNTSIYFKEGDLNTAKVRAKLTMQRKVIDITGCNVVVKIKTTTGRKINDVATIVDATNGIIEIDFKSNSLIEGTNFFELKIVKGESVKESAKLAYRVLDSIEDAGSIEGTNEYPILVQLIRDVNKAIANADRTLNIATDMQSDLDATINKANTAIANAKDATDKANKSVEDVNRALAAGTQDLEVKAAREDMDGVVHDTLKERLENDLKIGSKSLKQEVLDLAGLKESQDMAYSTDKGYLVCKETKNGTVKDLKISGKSLVNICGKRNFSVEGKESSLTNDLGKLTQPIPHGQEFTVILKVPKNLPNSKCFFKAYDKNGSGRADIFDGTELYNNRGSILVKNVTPTSTFDTDIVNVRLFASNTAGTFGVEDVIILIGDHSQNPPKEFFEGIASVGTGVDKIEVSSVKSDGNLFDIEKCVKLSNPAIERRYVLERRDIIEFTQGNNRIVLEDKFESNTQYVISFEGRKITSTDCRFSINYTDGTADTVSISNSNFELIQVISKPNKTVNTIRSAWSHGKSEIDLNTISIVKGNIIKPYYESQRDKITLLFKDSDGTWKPISELRGFKEVCDTIELHSNGKYYYHIRTEKRVYTPGDENDPKVITDKTNTISKLAEEKVFEVNPLFLEAFEGETSVFVNSGVVNAPIEFKIASYITNLVLLNQQRISLIEQEMFNMFKQVLNGDMYSLAEKLYPEDFIEEKYIATPIPEL